MKRVIKQVRDNWVLLAFIVSSIVSFTTMQNKVCAHAQDIEKLKLASETYAKDIAVIRNDISMIKEDSKNQGEKIDRLLVMVSRIR